MIVKRIGSKNDNKHKRCLNCNRFLGTLEDNVEKTCVYCGQVHFVDIRENRLILTAAEYPEFRKRRKEESEEC